MLNPHLVAHECSWLSTVKMFILAAHEWSSRLIQLRKIFVESEQKPSFPEGSLDLMEGWMKLYNAGSGSGSSKIAVRYWRVFGYLGLYPNHNHKSQVITRATPPTSNPHTIGCFLNTWVRTKKHQKKRSPPKLGQQWEWIWLLIQGEWMKMKFAGGFKLWTFSSPLRSLRLWRAHVFTIPKRTQRIARQKVLHILNWINLMTDSWIQELRNVV